MVSGDQIMEPTLDKLERRKTQRNGVFGDTPKLLHQILPVSCLPLTLIHFTILDGPHISGNSDSILNNWEPLDIVHQVRKEFKNFV